MNKPKRSEASITLEQRQAQELDKLAGQEAQAKLASNRRTRGRASLISGSEQGVGGDPLFQQKNAATAARIDKEGKALALKTAQSDADFNNSLIGLGSGERRQAITNRKKASLL